MNNSPSEKKTYDLEEKLFNGVEFKSRPESIVVNLGNYRIKTTGVAETVRYVKIKNISKREYRLYGNLSVSKISTTKKIKRKYGLFGEKIEKIKEEIKWKVGFSLDDVEQQFYYPLRLAEDIHKRLRVQKVDANLTKIEELLTDALQPYVQYAINICKTRNYIPARTDNPKCKLDI
jgi:hypothetical protein